LSTKHKRYIDKYTSFVVKFTFLFFSILSPSNYEIKRDGSDRKDSCTDDVRVNIHGIIAKKSNIDGPIKTSTSKS